MLYESTKMQLQKIQETITLILNQGGDMSPDNDKLYAIRLLDQFDHYLVDDLKELAEDGTSIDEEEEDRAKSLAKIIAYEKLKKELETIINRIFCSFCSMFGCKLDDTRINSCLVYEISKEKNEIIKNIFDLINETTGRPFDNVYGIKK